MIKKKEKISEIYMKQIKIGINKTYDKQKAFITNSNKNLHKFFNPFQQKLTNSKSDHLCSITERIDNEHNVMLEKELEKFRDEVEKKYSISELKDYIFPRKDMQTVPQYTVSYDCSVFIMCL